MASLDDLSNQIKETKSEKSVVLARCRILEVMIRRDNLLNKYLFCNFPGN